VGDDGYVRGARDKSDAAVATNVISEIIDLTRDATNAVRCRVYGAFVFPFSADDEKAKTKNK